MTRYGKIRGFVFLLTLSMIFSIYAADPLPVKAFGAEKSTDEFRDIMTDDLPFFSEEDETGSLSGNVYYDYSTEPPERNHMLLYGLFLLVGFVLGGGIVLLLKQRSFSKTGNAADSGRCRLHIKVLSGCCLTKQNNFRLKQNLYIGTNRKCDFRWKDGENISDIHAKIYMHDGTIYIEDMNSSFGTAINGMRIYAPNKLRNTDIISVGNARFQIFL